MHTPTYDITEHGALAAPMFVGVPVRVVGSRAGIGRALLAPFAPLTH